MESNEGWIVSLNQDSKILERSFPGNRYCNGFLILDGKVLDVNNKNLDQLKSAVLSGKIKPMNFMLDDLMDIRPCSEAVMPDMEDFLTRSNAKIKGLICDKVRELNWNSALFGIEIKQIDELRSAIDSKSSGAGLYKIDYVNIVGREAYISDSRLSKLELGNNIVLIDKYGFYNSTVSEIKFNTRLVGIQESAFECCKRLEKVETPKSLRFIGRTAFSHCEKLTTVDIQEGVEMIEPEAFSFCSNLEVVRIPPSVKFYGSRMFEGCKSLKRVFLPDNVDNNWLRVERDQGRLGYASN